MHIYESDQVVLFVGFLQIIKEAFKCQPVRSLLTGDLKWLSKKTMWVQLFFSTTIYAAIPTPTCIREIGIMNTR